MSELDSWVTMVCGELGITLSSAPAEVLDVARDVAHGVNRPAAPMTTFLLGRAVESGVPIEEAARRVSALAANWDYNDSTLKEAPPS